MSIGIDWANAWKKLVLLIVEIILMSTNVEPTIIKSVPIYLLIKIDSFEKSLFALITLANLRNW